MKAIENGVERGIFASRWLLAPIYVGLIGALFAVLVIFTKELIHLFEVLFTSHADVGVQAGDSLGEQASDLTLGVLGLLDLGLLANLILIVIFAGYENFVSKISVAEGNVDRPHWMGHIDFSGLKIKLIGSLVAISVIELLQDFVSAAEAADHPVDYTAVKWRIILHCTFLISGVMFAVMDYIGDKRKVLLDQHAVAMKAAGAHSTADRADGT